MKRTRRGFLLFLCAFFFGIMVAGTSAPADASEPTEQQLLVDGARVTFQSMLSDYGMKWLRDNLYQAKGVLIIPRLLKGGFILGGSGGRGVLLIKNDKTGQWSQPAFYTLGSASIGLQIGGAAAEIIMMVRTQKAVDKLLSSSFKIGGDISLTAGPFGQGVQSNVQTDIYSFARSQGLFAGIALDGTFVSAREKWNTAYYGKPVTLVDILISNMVSNPGSAELRNAVANAARIK